MSLDKNILEEKKHLHFIGIGGSGMFPIAQILKAKGFYITGSDNNESDTLTLARDMGIPVYMGQRAENIKGADLIIYSAAIMADNEELIASRQSGVPVVERSQFLGLVTSWYERCICVSGTHGKTTTTAMLTQALLVAGVDPTAVIGGKLPLIGGNGRTGNSQVMVCEACEFVDTFLELYPAVAVILNIGADHLDYFKSLDNIIASFRKFAQKATRALIINGDDENAVKAVHGLVKKRITFGFDRSNDYYPSDITELGGRKTRFRIMRGDEAAAEIELQVPGRHNVLNAVAAFAAAIEAGAEPEPAARGLSEFRGAGRRFEILGDREGVTYADDYAHHPLEIEVTLKTARKMGYNKIWAVFQPFTYSRTAMMLDEFASVLSLADHVVMSEIMGSREKNTYGIYTSDLAAKIEGSVWFDGFNEIAAYVVERARPGDLVITLGCGDIYKCARLMLDDKALSAKGQH